MREHLSRVPICRGIPTQALISMSTGFDVYIDEHVGYLVFDGDYLLPGTLHRYLESWWHLPNRTTDG